jgi:hypothetical protein
VFRHGASLGLGCPASALECSTPSTGSTPTRTSPSSLTTNRVEDLEALAGEAPSDEHLGPALDEMLSDSERLTRSLLGVEETDVMGPPDGTGPGPDDLPPGPGVFPAEPGWMVPGPVRRRRPSRRYPGR